MAETIESAGGGLVASAEPYGQTGDEIAAFQQELAAGPLSEYVQGARTRLLRFARDEDRANPGNGPDRYTATIYDYTNTRTLDVTGSLERLDDLDVRVSARQPIPSHAEIDEAAAIVADKHPLGSAIRSGAIRTYQPMPPFIPMELPDGRSRRVLAVALQATDDTAKRLLGARHQLTGVDLSSGELITAEPQDEHQEPVPVPPILEERDQNCGAPVGEDNCAHTGDVGQLEIVVREGNPGAAELWRLVVVRPAESSGTNGSGVELRNVSYRGRDVFRRAHVPILNVQYEDPTAGCGPSFRDWLFHEVCFEVLTGNDPLPGFRLAKRPPQTMIESGEDGGNFRGVAVYFDGQDLLLTSEMSAGWYRYITEWRLKPDGTIRPRMGLSAVQNFCTCQLHIHHGYFRFDFNVDGAGANFVDELNTGGLLGSDERTRLLFETQRARDEAADRRWEVGNAQTGASYLITPFHDDGTADLYGAGDTWHLRFHEGEIDDGQSRFDTNPLRTRARIDLFADGEPIDGQDIVSWYAVHFEHDAFELEGVGEYLGPTLTSSWGQPVDKRAGMDVTPTTGTG